MGACAQEDVSFPEGWLWSAANTLDGSHQLQSARLGSNVAVSTTLPVRAHAAVVRPGGRQVLAVSRRPGTQCFVVDVASGELLQTLESPAGRHYLGHGVFDAQGRYFFATENSYDESPLPDLTPRDSVVGIYDATQGYQRVGELPTYGVGAHEVALAANGRTLIIANGGIYTHPSRPREKLNLDSMRPSLAYVNIDDGSLLDKQSLGDSQLSIRHLAYSASGAVIVGCQHAGTPTAAAPLLYTHSVGETLRPLQGSESTWEQFDSYIASVAIHQQSGRVAATSPNGGLVGFWDLDDGDYLGSQKITDCSGIAAADDCFVITTGLGEIAAVDAYDLSSRGARTSDNTRWDNHCLVVPTATL
jgi:hypothetical protein